MSLDRPGNGKSERLNGTVLTPIETIIPGIDSKGLVQNQDVLREQDTPHEIAVEGHVDHVRKKESIAASTEAAHLLEELTDKDPKILKLFESLKNQIVLDIGPGPRVPALSLLAKAGVSAYIGVEANFAGSIVTHLNKTNAAAEPTVTIVREDALSFLRRLPEESVSIFCSGLDRTVVQDEEYIKRVNAEISRVLHPAGAYFNYADSVFEPPLRKKIHKLQHDRLRIFRRKTQRK